MILLLKILFERYYAEHMKFKISYLPLVYILLGFFQHYAIGQEIIHRVYLIGDGGAIENGKHAVIEQIKEQSNELQIKGIKVDFLFLGDNIYPRGMPALNSPLREVSEKILSNQTGLVAKENRAWFIPGNHDWEQGRPGGLNAILRQQAFIDSLGQSNIHWPVRDGCAGPEEILLNDRTILVMVDSQWWLHPYGKGGERNDCEYKTKDDVILALKDIFIEHRDKVVLLAIHHPPFTYGEHNGAYGLKQHLFPLTDIKPKLWIPLPLIGSIYPIYRSVFGNVQDISHPMYKDLNDRILPLIANHSCVIIASGHDHVLQYQQKGKAHFIVSGSAAKTSRLRKKNPLEFGSEARGFATLDYLSDSTLNISFFIEENSRPVFVKNVQVDEKLEPYTEEIVIGYPDKVNTPISYRYYANKLQKRFLGTNYRKEWQTSVEMPVFNLHEQEGGLSIVKRGGGMQTRSLRMEDSFGVEYTLRSVEKYPELAIPAILRQTIAKEIVQDQISASNPFGALVIPTLASAAGVLHLKPKLYWLSDEPTLGHFREDFSENVYLFESRDVSAELIPFEDYKIYSTDKLIAKIEKDNDNLINQESVLKARILDLFIGDWDRHEDQWRWVGRETEKGFEFFPVPRDRDQAFFVNQGLLPRIASRKWIMPKFQGFDYEIRDVNGFMFNARHVDRSFLNNLSREDWETIIQELTAAWTDEVIEEAMQQLPTEIYDIRADEIASKLKYRRSWLLEKGLVYYKFLAKEVDIVGTAKRELFEIDLSEDGSLRIKVSKITNKNKIAQAIHDRVYYPEETNEIRLFGMGDEDEFNISGYDTGAGIRIRVLGGESKNHIQDLSKGEKSSLEYYFYSGQKDHVSIKASSKSHYDKHVEVFEYDRKAFEYDVISPIPSIEYNVDDGFYLGGGLAWTKHGFRKNPYKISQAIKANVALLTGAFNFYYDAHAVNIFPNWDLEWHADIRAPNYIHNFYGFGNETTFSRENFDPRFFWARINMSHASVFLRKPLGGYANFKFGPTFQNAKLDDMDNDGRFIIDTDLSGLDTDFIIQRKLYSGVSAQIFYERVDKQIMPSRGISFLAEAKHLEGLNTFSNRMSSFSADFAIYWSFKENSRFTWATRFGGGKNFGNYEFFQAQNLGAKVNLRGYRRFRFAGDGALYNNTELRIRFFNLKTYLFPASSGMILFHDVGRVFLDGEQSNTWHNGYGLGLWVAPLNRIVMLGNLSFSKEGTLPSVTFGFQF